MGRDLDNTGARGDNGGGMVVFERRTGSSGQGPRSESGTNRISASEHEEPMPSLTPEQREALALAIGREGYARIDDYVVLKAEVYDRLRAAADDGLDMIQVGSLVESTMREEDAGDPLLDSYQSYRP